MLVMIMMALMMAMVTTSTINSNQSSCLQIHG